MHLPWYEVIASIICLLSTRGINLNSVDQAPYVPEDCQWKDDKKNKLADTYYETRWRILAEAGVDPGSYRGQEKYIQEHAC